MGGVERGESQPIGGVDTTVQDGRRSRAPTGSVLRRPDSPALARDSSLPLVLIIISNPGTEALAQLKNGFHILEVEDDTVDKH